MHTTLPDRVIARLVGYRRLLEQLHGDGVVYVFSHSLAQLCGVTAAQVRRDVMELAMLGNPAKGYRVEELLSRIVAIMDPPHAQKAVLAGAGRLGSALVSYFNEWSPKLKIVGVFDSAPSKIQSVVHGHTCRPLSELSRIVRRQKVDVGIISVPAEAAADVAARMIEAGVKGILNFAPVKFDVPGDVYVEQADLTVAIERVAYMARHCVDRDPRNAEGAASGAVSE